MVTRRLKKVAGTAGEMQPRQWLCGLPRHRSGGGLIGPPKASISDLESGFLGIQTQTGSGLNLPAIGCI